MTEEQLNKPMTVRSLQAATRKTKEKVEGKIEEVEQKYHDLEQKQVELTQEVEEAKGKVIQEGDTQVARIATEIDPKIDAISAECERQKAINVRQGYEIENLKALAEKRISEEKSITTENGTATLENDYVAKNAFVGEVIGDSIPWNQLNDVVTITRSNVGYHGMTGTLNLVAGHKYAFFCHISYTITSSDGQVYFTGVDTEYGLGASTDFYKIISPSQNGTEKVYLDIRRTLPTPLVATCYVIDLTMIETTDLAWVRAYAEAHPQYDAGSLQSSRNVQVRSVGANIFDGKTFTVGGNYHNASGALDIGATIKVATGDVLPSEKYILDIKSSGSGYVRLCNLTSGGAFIGRSAVALSDGENTVEWETTSTTGKLEIAIDTVADVVGVYTPHSSQIVPSDGGFKALDGSPLELKEGDVFDPYTGMLSESWKTKDASTLEWEPREGFWASKISDKKKQSANVIYGTLPVVPVSSSNMVTTEGILYVYTGNDTNLYVKGTAKPNLDGNILYELAEPIPPHKVAEPIDNSLRIEGGSTISVLCEGAQAEATVHYLKKYIGGTV